MTISERLKAVKHFQDINTINEDGSGFDAHGNAIPCGVLLEIIALRNVLSSIQTGIDSAECDAGKLATDAISYVAREGHDPNGKRYRMANGEPFDGTNYDFVRGIIATALLAQREKYDALIAKAETDAGRLVYRIEEQCVAEKAGRILLNTDAVYDILTAALLKARQKENLERL